MAAAAAAVAAANDGVSWRPMVMPCLENLNLPYADDSAAVTPSSDDLCSIQNTHLVSSRLALAFRFILHEYSVLLR